MRLVARVFSGLFGLENTRSQEAQKKLLRLAQHNRKELHALFKSAPEALPGSNRYMLCSLPQAVSVGSL